MYVKDLTISKKPIIDKCHYILTLCNWLERNKFCYFLVYFTSIMSTICEFSQNLADASDYYDTILVDKN